MQEIVKFKSDTGLDVVITPEDVTNYLCPQATPGEVAMFLQLCRAQRLNPFVKDAYLVKYGNQAASIITGKEVFTKRAAAREDYEGFEAGVVFIDRNATVQHREGSAIYSAAGEVLVGGWCRVYVKGRRPFYDEVSLQEYSTGKAMWAKMPATMVRKVALVHCLREAFPDDFQGLYSAEEMGRAGEVVPQVAQPLEVPAQVIDTAATEAQQQQLDTLAREFATLRGVDVADVYNAIFNSATMQAAGAQHGALTATQADLACKLTAGWITKAQAQAAPVVYQADAIAEAQFVEVGTETGEVAGEYYEQDVAF